MVFVLFLVTLDALRLCAEEAKLAIAQGVLWRIGLLVYLSREGGKLMWWRCHVWLSWY
jgi:hypothetical protein